ncbi:MAG: hypothetical protein WDO68_04160 [Gammaproteobacteria bacterium]
MGDPIAPSPSSSATNVHVRIEQPQPNPGVEDSQPVLAPEVVAPPTAHTTPNNLAWLHGQLKELRDSLEEVDGSGELRERISELAKNIGSEVEQANIAMDERGDKLDPGQYSDRHYIQFNRDNPEVVDKIYPLLTSGRGVAFCEKAVNVVQDAAMLVSKRLDDLDKPDSAAKKVLKVGAKILFWVGVALSAGGAFAAAMLGAPVVALGLILALVVLAVVGLSYRAYRDDPEQMRKDLNAAHPRVNQFLSKLYNVFPQTARIEKVEIASKPAERSSDVIVLSAQPQNAS